MPRERGHLRFGYVAGPLYLGPEQLNASRGAVPIFRVNWMNRQSPVHNQIVNITVEYKDMCIPVLMGVTKRECRDAYESSGGPFGRGGRLIAGVSPLVRR
jgi:hypothetical protein